MSAWNLLDQEATRERIAAAVPRLAAACNDVLRALEHLEEPDLFVALTKLAREYARIAGPAQLLLDALAEGGT